MLNLIKMDLYRLVHSVSFRVMLIVVVLVATFSLGMTKLDVDMTKDAMEQGLIQEEDTEVPAENDEVMIEIGFFMDTQSGWTEQVPFSNLMHAEFASKILLILCVIFVPIFVNAEYKNGYIKNIAGQLPNRGLLVVSKLVVAAVQILILFVLYLVTGAILAKLFFGSTLVLGSVSDLLFTTGMHYLLSLSVSFVILMLTIVTRNSAFPMTFGIFCSTGIMSLVYTGINTLAYLMSDSKKFDISQYMPDTNMNFVTLGMESSTLLRVVLVGMVYIVLSAVISMAVMKKRDI